MAKGHLLLGRMVGFDASWASAVAGRRAGRLGLQAGGPDAAGLGKRKRAGLHSVRSGGWTGASGGSAGAGPGRLDAGLGLLRFGLGQIRKLWA